MGVYREKAALEPSKKKAIREPKREASGETKLPNSLILDFQNCEK